MIVADPSFRPNPARAVFVQGAIDQQLIHRLTPRIFLLQSNSRFPITVYIDSPGGNIASMETLWRLLKVSNQDYDDPCRIITVVTSRAASAAADLLSSGDYAIALPQSTVMYHGVRASREMPLTVEATSMLAHILRMTNDTYAMDLARKIEGRFMFRLLILRNQFETVRERNAPKEMSDYDCFLELISDRLSDRAKKVFATARDRHGRYVTLLKTVLRKNKSSANGKSVAATEASRIKAIVDFEVASHKNDPNWTFQFGGLARLNDDFYLLNEHLASSQSERLKQLCIRWGRFALSPSESKEINQLPETDQNDRMIEKVRPFLEALWAFFVALCHALQEGENDLTAIDAFWLGLIDEVMGEKELPSLRYLVEYKADEGVQAPQPEQPEARAAKAPPGPDQKVQSESPIQ